MKHLYIFFVAIAFYSCNPVKKVLSDPEKLNKVGREWEKQNPCIPTEPEFIKGKDSVVYTRLIDTIWETEIDTVPVPSKPKIKYIKEKVIIDSFRVDTLREADPRRENELKKDIARLEGQSNVHKENWNAEKSSRRKWQTYFWILLAIGFGGGVLLTYLKLKR